MTTPVDTRYIVIPSWDQNAALWQHCYCNLMLQLHSVFLQFSAVHYFDCASTKGSQHASGLCGNGSDDHVPDSLALTSRLDLHPAPRRCFQVMCDRR